MDSRTAVYKDGANRRWHFEGTLYERELLSMHPEKLALEIQNAIIDRIAAEMVQDIGPALREAVIVALQRRQAQTMPPVDSKGG